MKRCVLFLFLSFFIFTAAAQQNKETTEKDADKKSAKKEQKSASDDNEKRKNFFIGAAAKADIYVNDNGGSDINVWKHPTLAGKVFVGKWFNQYIGSRVVLELGVLKPNFQKRTWIEDENYFLGRVDLLFDLTNCFRSYSPDHTYNLIPYVGIGGAKAFNAHHRPDKARGSSSFVMSGGLLNMFRVSDKWSVLASLGLDVVRADFDGYKDKKKFNGIAAGAIGVIYNFN